MTAMIEKTLTGTTEELPPVQPHLFQQGIPPELVRRSYDRDVFVTNLRVLGDSTFEVTARWPAEHPFYGPRGGSHDPLLLPETVREAQLLIAHFALQVPKEHKFITHDHQFDIDPAGLATAGDEPVDVVVRLTAHDIKRRGQKLAGMRMEAECLRDGVRIGGATYRWSCVTPAVYKRLRGEYLTAAPLPMSDLKPIEPRLVGRTHDVDVMLAGSACDASWEARFDPANSVVFDHRVDHVPGNGCIEAARQAALLAIGSPDAIVVRGDLAFARYLEFDTPCVVSASRVGGVDGTHTVKVVFEQNDGTSAEGILDLVVKD